ncbi:MAG: 50S ribosomal protein L1 [Candidatus Omnitrophica bacterium]|nr:50S ribosomal protein L1 [Candidatus Omnitrophota bacterium]
MNKRLKQASTLYNKAQAYKLDEAVAIIKKCPVVKFDESVDLSIRLNIDTKELSQSVRGFVVLPHGTGKKTKVAVFCKADMADKAKACGADIAGADDLVQKVLAGYLDFDVVIATPDIMRDISKLGKVLGPRGLMPSPKAGTVTNDIEKAIAEIKAGKVEFKMDKLGCVNMTVAKRSFNDNAIVENAESVLKAVSHARPAHAKGKFLRSVSISTTMGCGVKLDLAAYSV